MGAAFAPVEEALREVFLPALFRGLTEGLLTRENTRLPVKQAGLVIPDLVLMAPENWTASCVITGHLVSALRGCKYWIRDGQPCLLHRQAGVFPRQESLRQSPEESREKNLPEGLLYRGESRAHTKGYPLHKSPLLLEVLLQSCICRLRVL